MGNDNLLADSHDILKRWKNYICKLQNVHDMIDVRQAEMHPAELLVPEPISFEAEIATVKMKSLNKSPDIDKSTTELIQAGGNT
jgi:hypothetical protein